MITVAMKKIWEKYQMETNTKHFDKGNVTRLNNIININDHQNQKM